MNRVRTIAALAALVIILAACGPTASSGSAEPSSQASIAESPAAQASDGDNEPEFSEGAVADLEALIPDIAGVTWERSSMQGNEFLVTADDPAMIAFLQDTGVSPSDVSMAVGIGFSAETGTSVVMGVFRAKGADSARLMSALKESWEADRETPLEWSTTTFGGKQVEAASDAGQTLYFYSKGDLLVYVSASDPAVSEEVISGLP